ncbi:MAG: zinc-dependent alcohol dehydrogenase family protein [Sedimentisphaerales bacterium]|nr:zinc-dependent alcohol dehydrogenase family protein [Sedimentisphaerales bacterium]
MKAVVLPRIAPIEDKPLREVEMPAPQPGTGEILVKVSVCGLCHTDLDEIEGRLEPPALPVVLGHQVVGSVAERGAGATRYEVGDRVGVTWLFSSCGACAFCRTGRENLCEQARWTGKDAPGGYAEFMVVGEDFAQAIPVAFSDSQAAPLLCAGVIGYRAVRLGEISDGQTIGLFGFGASAHIVIQIVRHQFPHSDVFVFTRSGHHRELARRLGAAWTGGPGDTPPARVDKAIDFTPVGEAVRDALVALHRGGRLVINAIRKTTPIPELAYHEYLWDEKEIKSVANVTRRDAAEFLPLAAQIGIRPTVEQFGPRQANEALVLMKRGKLKAAGVLVFA